MRTFRYKNIIVSVCDYSGAWSQPYADNGTLVLQVDPKLDTCDHKGYGYGDSGTHRLTHLGPNRLGLACTAGRLVAMVQEEGGYALDALFEATLPDGYDGVEVGGLLMAPPCTDYSSSGARWFAAKDEDGRTAASNAVVRDCLSLVDLLAPDFWCLENPVGRIQRCVPEVGPVRMRFNPNQFAGLAAHDQQERESMSKRTCLYGNFNANLIDDPRDIIWYTDSKGNRGSWQWMHLGGKSERTKEKRSTTPTGFAKAFFLANPLREDNVFTVEHMD